MKKNTLIGGVACLAMSLMFFTSCKKEEITSKKSVTSSENQGMEMPDYKFSAVAKIPGENPENGFLNLKVSSNDEEYLKKYIAKLEQTKIVMTEVNSAEEDQKNVKPLFGEEESTSSVALDFNWDSFSFNRQKGKMYQIRIASTDQSKSLVYYTAYSNVHQFNSSWGYAAVNAYCVYRYWDLSCLCYKNMNNSKWYFSNGQSYFYNQTMSYHDNLEMRIFQNSSNNTSPTYTNFPYFTINGIVTYYRPRTNYTGPDMPAGYMDVTAITSAYGSSLLDPFMPSYANLTLYIAG
ncbi:hypothetical protein [Fluviicola taffensis]|uniref:hypothetical protein n=1 Tax=Fluviicola taffensis TaxID=191579 RepID=UPI0031380E65